jgi:hypothetical protein
MASEMEKKAQWYQRTTLKIRVTVISSRSTVQATRAAAARRGRGIFSSATESIAVERGVPPFRRVTLSGWTFRAVRVKLHELHAS